MGGDKMPRCSERGDKCKPITEKFYICANCGLIASNKKEVKELIETEKCRGKKQHMFRFEKVKICRYCGALFEIEAKNVTI